MFLFLLSLFFSLAISILFPNFIFLTIISIVILYLSIKYKRKIFLLNIIIIIYGFIASPKPYPIPDNSYKELLTVYQQNLNYSLLKDQQNRLFLTYEDYGPIGSSIVADVSYSQLNRINFPGMNEFADFLNNQGVYFEIKIINKSNHAIAQNIRNQVINYLIKDNQITKPFLKLILFSDRSESEDFYNKLKDLSVLHLFVISGFHINILFITLKNLLKRFIKNDFIILFIIIPYLYLLDFSIPSVKAFIFILLNIISINYFQSKVDRLTNLSIVALVILMASPTAIRSYSFILSILASLNIELISKIKIKNKFLKYSLINILIYLGILPVIMVINYEFNFMAIIYNLILSFIVPPLYIVSFFSLFLNTIQFLLIPLIQGFNSFTDFIYDFRIMLIMGKPNNLFIIIYYFNYYLLIISLEINNSIYYSKLLLSQVLILTFQYYKPYLLPSSSVSFLNVNQGDSTLIITEYAKQVILIDTGGSKFFEVSKSRIIPYLKFLGLKHVDYVITTHNDFDHVGSLPYLVNNFNVKKVIDGQTIKSLGLLTNANYGNDSLDDNNRSSVFYFTMKKTSFLLTADIDSSVEKKIVDGNDLKVDVLKVSHHGSRFGTSQYLLDKIKPSIAIISAGRNNIYNHPHPSVTQRLIQNNIKILRTDKDGTIVFLFNQISLLNTILNPLKYVIINIGDLYGLFSPWLSKTISR